MEEEGEEGLSMEGQGWVGVQFPFLSHDRLRLFDWID